MTRPNTKITKAIIPAAGLGTRFLPMTKSSPKEMLPIVDKPVIQFVIEEAVASGIEDILIVTGRGKRAIENHFDSAPGLQMHLERQGKTELAHTVRDIGDHANIFFVRQKEQLGLGDAVKLGRSFVGADPFALLLGDTIIEPGEEGGIHGLQELMQVYERYQSSVVAVREVPDEWLSRYGIVDGKPLEGSDGRLYGLNRLIEKPTAEEAPTNLAIAGRYIFTPEIFSCLDKTGMGKGNEIQLTDAMNILASRSPMQALHWNAERYDIGNKADYVRCFMEFAAKHPETRDEMAKYLREH